MCARPASTPPNDMMIRWFSPGEFPLEVSGSPGTFRVLRQLESILSCTLYVSGALDDFFECCVPDGADAAVVSTGPAGRLFGNSFAI